MSMRRRDRHDSGTIGLQRWFGGGLLNLNFEWSQAFLTLPLIFRATEAAPNCWKWSIPLIRFANPTNHYVWPDATSDGRALSLQFEHLVSGHFAKTFATTQKTNGSNTTEESLRKERDMFQEDVEHLRLGSNAFSPLVVADSSSNDKAINPRASKCRKQLRPLQTACWLNSFAGYRKGRKSMHHASVESLSIERRVLIGLRAALQAFNALCVHARCSNMLNSNPVVKPCGLSMIFIVIHMSLIPSSPRTSSTSPLGEAAVLWARKSRTRAESCTRNWTRFEFEWFLEHVCSSVLLEQVQLSWP